MSDWSVAAGQVLTILVMAVALGMDAFSLGIGIGLEGIRRLDVLRLSAMIALFHILMPLGGMVMGVGVCCGRSFAAAISRPATWVG